MSKVKYESGKSSSYRQDVSLEHIGKKHSSEFNESLIQKRYDEVKHIQPGYAREDETPMYGVPLGLEVLRDVERFVIRQVYESEAWWGSPRFKVENERGVEILKVEQEKAKNSCIQAVFGQMRQYFMKVCSNKECIMEFEHPSSCLSPMFCPWTSPSLIVRMPTGEILGQVKNASRETCGSCLPPTKYFDVFSYEGRTTHSVVGPTCHPCECSRSNPASFELLETDKSGRTKSIGEITHTWRGCLGGCCSCCITAEPEVVSINFPKESRAEDKALFLSLAFLMLFTYFEVK